MTKGLSRAKGLAPEGDACPSRPRKTPEEESLEVTVSPKFTVTEKVKQNKNAEELLSIGTREKNPKKTNNETEINNYQIKKSKHKYANGVREKNR